MKIRNFLIAGVLLFAVFFLSTCVDDKYDLGNFSSDMELNTALIGPIGKSSISIRDLFQKLNVEDSLHTKADGVLYFRYDTISRIDIKQMKLQLEGSTPRSFEGEDDPYLLDLAQNRQMTFSEEIDFGLTQLSEEEGEARIDSILLRKAKMIITVNSNMPNLLDRDLDLWITFPPEIRLPGNQSSIYVERPIGNEIEIDLENAFIDFSNGSFFELEFIASLPVGSTVTLEPSSFLEFTTSFSDGLITYNHIWGYLDGFEYQEERDDLGINLFDDLADKDVRLRLTDPKLFLSAVSNIGAPTLFRIDYVQAANTRDRFAVSGKFTGSVPPESYRIPFAYTMQDGVAQTAFDRVFNNEEVNMSEMLEIEPDSMVSGYTIRVCDNASSEESYSVTGDAYIDLDWGVEIPAWFNKGTYINMHDTVFNIEFGDIVENDFNLDQAIFYFELSNRLPFEVKVEFRFLDEYDQLIEELTLAPLHVGIARINQYKATEATTAATDLELNSSMIESLKRVKHLDVYYKIDVPETLESPSVKVIGTDFLKVDISCFLKGGIKF